MEEEKKELPPPGYDKELPPGGDNEPPAPEPQEGDSDSELDTLNTPAPSMPTAPTPIKSTSRQKNATSGSNMPGGTRDKYKKLNDLIVSQIGGMGLSMMSTPFFRKDGVVLFAHTQKLSDSMVDCARVNETMYKTLVTIFSGAVWTVLVLEVASISAAIMSNHNVLQLQ